jgi:hypothetical protein
MVGNQPATSLLGVFDEMKLTLTFDGDIPSVGNAKSLPSPGKLAAIWAMRDAFHAQLEHLWETHHLLQGRGSPQARAAATRLNTPILLHGRQFVALVRNDMPLKCELEVRMLVNHSPGSLITKAGDLDNRIKGVIDALRMPGSPDELRKRNSQPNIYACLMQDDAVITGLKVSVERYLGCPSQSAQWARLTIAVTISPTENEFITEPFITD